MYTSRGSNTREVVSYAWRGSAKETDSEQRKVKMWGKGYTSVEIARKGRVAEARTAATGTLKIWWGATGNGPENGGCH